MRDTGQYFITASSVWPDDFIEFCPKMCPTLEGDMPTASAIIVRLQCVALDGVSCTVFAITVNRISLGSGGTREGRVLSRLSPGTPSSRIALATARPSASTCPSAA